MRVSTLISRLTAKKDAISLFWDELEDTFGTRGVKLEYFPREEENAEVLGQYGYLSASVKLNVLWDTSNAEEEVLNCFKHAKLDKFFALSGSGVGGGWRDVGFYEIPLK